MTCEIQKIKRIPSESLGSFSRDEARALFRELLPGEARNSAGVILAVSGGPDSIAMMLLFAWMRDEFAGLPAIVASVDHGLRPESSAEVASVALWARECGFTFRALRWDGEKPAAGIQAAARAARYDLLTGLARETGASHLLTAHTLDDQAETILMRLLRGSGPAGLQGMARQTQRGSLTHLRPFLETPKSRLLALCQSVRAQFLEDPSNTDSKFTRARLRKVMDALAPEGLTAERLAVLGARLRLAESALDETAARALEHAAQKGAPVLSNKHAALKKPLAVASAESPHAYSYAAFAAQPLAIRRRMLALALDRLAIANALEHRLERLESLAARLGELPPGAGKPRRFTIAGAMLTLTTRGILIFQPEKARRRGANPRANFIAL